MNSGTLISVQTPVLLRKVPLLLSGSAGIVTLLQPRCNPSPPPLHHVCQQPPVPLLSLFCIFAVRYQHQSVSSPLHQCSRTLLLPVLILGSSYPIQSSRPYSGCFQHRTFTMNHSGTTALPTVSQSAQEHFGFKQRKEDISENRSCFMREHSATTVKLTQLAS